MDISEVNRRFGATSRKFVWSTRPTYVFDLDGTERADLDPVPALLEEHFEDDQGWWTCHKDTEVGDLAVIYRNGRPNEAGALPKNGPKDFRYVVLATSPAFELQAEDDAGEFTGYWACQYTVVAEFTQPVTLADARDDDVLASWPALRAGFVQAAMPMPDEVWDRMLCMARRKASGKNRVGRKHVEPEVRRQTERRLEEWLAAHPKHLSTLLGFAVEVVGRQVVCAPHHNGIIDLLVRRQDRPTMVVAVELKAAAIRRDAVAQALGYVGWLREQAGVHEALGLVLGLDLHDQVPYVQSTVNGLITLAHWDDVPLPSNLRRELQV